MAEKTKIEWTNFRGNPGSTWNILTGCSKVSQGCKFCYAERWAKRGMGQFAKNPDRKFTEVMFHADKLNDPLKWKRPRMIFVCSMSDLFHESIDFEVLEPIFETMYKAEQHIFLVLTKRPERMKEFYHWFDSRYTGWKQRNVWLGVSIEDQATADERIPILASIPAYIRFISAEPLLDVIDLNKRCFPSGPESYLDYIHWVITGGESGPKARPSIPDWFRLMRAQCEESNVPFFFKQWGEWVDYKNSHILTQITGEYLKYEKYEKSFYTMYKIGKAKAGRLLDNVEHLAFPSLADEHFRYYYPQLYLPGSSGIVGGI